MHVGLFSHSIFRIVTSRGFLQYGKLSIGLNFKPGSYVTATRPVAVGHSHATNVQEVIKMKTPAVVLIVIGVAIVIWGAFGFTTREKVVDIGPIHASKDTHHDVPYGTLAGGVIVLGGVLLLAKSKN
jgi:hypothetical protein